MPTEIRFGTDGWRALIAEDYTYANVARCARGLCDYMKGRGTADKWAYRRLRHPLSVA